MLESRSIEPSQINAEAAQVYIMCIDCVCMSAPLILSSYILACLVVSEVPHESLAH